MTRDDLEQFCRLNLDFESIGLMRRGWEDMSYFCTPVGAELVGTTGVDGVHFVLLPGEEGVFCVDPAMGEPGTYVLPVAENFRTFLSYVLYCRDASPISQIWWMGEDQFHRLLREDARARWPGCEAFSAKKDQALGAIAAEFHLVPADPYGPVRALQRAFDPEDLKFSEEYYDILGL